MEHLIELKDVYKIYHMGDEDVHALDGVSLTIDKGEFVAIVGQSGSGKSTAMNIIGCLDVPTSGTYHLGGVDVSTMDDDQQAEIRNKMLGFIFQQYNLIPKLTVLENVELPLLYAGVGAEERKERAVAALGRVGLADKQKNLPSQLSGGQQQRVALARAMATEPKVLLLDEPLSNLDASLRLRMRGELKRLQRKTGMTMIFVTHDQEEALSLSDRIAVMKQGCIVQNGTPEEIYYEPANEEIAAFIGKTNPDFLRPEELFLTEDPAASCTILERQFMGSHTEYLVTDGERNWQVSMFGQAGSRFQPGMKVRLGMPEKCY